MVIFSLIQHLINEYFLNSSDKIRFFYEDGAFDADGKLCVAKNCALNKIGHGNYSFVST
jgi:hypothetical protein